VNRYAAKLADQEKKVEELDRRRFGRQSRQLLGLQKLNWITRWATMEI